jgi:hypothetical protein
MKAILEFNLPEDDHEFRMATTGANMHSVLWEYDQWLRSNIKYAPDTMSDEEHNTYEKCRQQLHEFMSDSNVSFD